MSVNVYYQLEFTVLFTCVNRTSPGIYFKDDTANLVLTCSSPLRHPVCTNTISTGVGDVGFIFIFLLNRDLFLICLGTEFTHGGKLN